MHCLGRHSQVTVEHHPISALVIDGAVVVKMLKPTGCETFQDYSNNDFNPYISRQLSTVQRLDVVWDVYEPEIYYTVAQRERRQTKGASRHETLR